MLFIISSGVIAQSYEEKIVARINDNIILKSELEQALMGRQNITEKQKKSVLNKMINRKIIYLEASENKEIEISDEKIEQQVDSMIDNMRDKFGGDAALRQALQKQGMSINNLRANYRNRIRENLYVKEYVNKEIRPNVNITEEEVKNFYEENKNKFSEGTKYTYEIAFLPVDVTQKDINGIKDKLNDVREKILSKKITFEKAAEKFSDGPSSERGGLLGYVQKGQVVDEFEKVLFNMDKGEISKPFKTKHGYQIVYLEDIKNNKRKASHILIFPKPSERKIETYYNNFKSKFDSMGWKNLKSWAKKQNVKFYNFNQVGPQEINPIIMKHLKNTEKLSKPFYFNKGIVIVYLKNKKESKRPSYGEIKPRVKNILMSRKVDKKMTEIANELRNKYYVEVLI